DLIVSAGLSKVIDNKLVVKEETFDCLIIPYSEALPMPCIERLAAFANQGLEVIFVDGLPMRSSEGVDASASLERLAAMSRVTVVGLEELAEHLISRGYNEIKAEGDHPYLRYYHV